jgi:hypothetical protein
MKKLCVAAAAFTFTVFAAPVLADAGSSCHFHGSKAATEAVVIDCATQRKASLIKDGKLDASWQNVQPAKPESVDGKKGKEWKVVFKNQAATDKSKDTLYMFYTPTGNFIAANFTGQ